MYAKQLMKAIKLCFENKQPLLISGAPGIGKSDIVAQASRELGYDLFIEHPVISDPTDYKGCLMPRMVKRIFYPSGM